MVTKKKPKKETAVAVKKGGELTPNFLMSEDTLGICNIDSSDLTIPRIKLIHATSPEHIDNCVPAGNFYHEVTETDLGPELTIVPVMVKKAFVLWRPRWDRSGASLLARADDGIHWKPPEGEWQVLPYKGAKKPVTWRTKKTVADSGLDLFGSTDPDNPDSHPAASRVINILCYLPDFPDESPAVFSMQRSQLKVAAKLLSNLKIACKKKKVNTFAYNILLESVRAENFEGEDYLNIKTKLNGFVDEDTHSECMSIFEAFKDKDVVVKMDDSQQGESEEEEAPEGSPDI